MRKGLVDTDIIIDYLRGIDKARILIDESISHTEIYISIITKMELLAGCRNKREIKIVEDLFDRFITIYPDEISIKTAYSLFKKYRLSHGIGIFDSLIAATAIHNEIHLLTKNSKHFSMIKTLTLIEALLII